MKVCEFLNSLTGSWFTVIFLVISACGLSCVHSPVVVSSSFVIGLSVFSCISLFENRFILFLKSRSSGIDVNDYWMPARCCLSSSSQWQG